MLNSIPDQGDQVQVPKYVVDLNQLTIGDYGQLETCTVTKVDCYMGKLKQVEVRTASGKTLWVQAGDLHPANQPVEV